MKRQLIQERPDWEDQAKEYGFEFHTMHGERYWDERAYYSFTLKQIEDHLEDPSEEIHKMCLAVVEKVVNSEELLRKFRIPEKFWDFIRNSWVVKDPSLYSRLDLRYDGKSPAKLYENNADTPTSVYETGFWQWLWLEDVRLLGWVPEQADQFNSLQDKLVERFNQLRLITPDPLLHFGSCKESKEDRGTVQYLADCASEAGILTTHVNIEDIGRDNAGCYTDLEDRLVTWMFKLYPWEFMFVEEFGDLLFHNSVKWLEPPWKAILSNKAILPVLWQMFPDHPNLLPAFFEGEQGSFSGSLVKKPLYSREGANISILGGVESEGPYGEEGFIYQETCMLPEFAGNHAVIGSWLVNDKPAGISIREDKGPITQDMSRFLPHIILD